MPIVLGLNIFKKNFEKHKKNLSRLIHNIKFFHLQLIEDTFNNKMLRINPTSIIYEITFIFE